MDKIESQTINNLRFPLSILVVCIHASVVMEYAEQAVLFQYVCNFLSEGIARVAVPLFFSISGYLFFIKGYAIDKYTSKLRKRVFTLLIPYIFWNAICIVAWIGITFLMPASVANSSIQISQFGLLEYIRCFWNIIGGALPINGPLWFIRNLMIFVLLAPGIHYLIKTFGKYMLIALTCLYVCQIGEDWFIKLESILFFCIGSYYSINGRNLFKKVNMGGWLTVIWITFVIVTLFIPELKKTSILFGFLACRHIAYTFTTRYNAIMKPIIERSNFFIYCYHGLPIIFLGKAIITICDVNSDLGYLFTYLFLIFIIVSCGICLYIISSKYLPNFTKTICGERYKK